MQTLDGGTHLLGTSMDDAPFSGTAHHRCPRRCLSTGSQGIFLWGLALLQICCRLSRTSFPHINHKEVLAQTLAASHLAPNWQNQHVIIPSDNVAAVYIINESSAANPFVICALRQLLWLSAIYNFRFTAIHIPGKSKVCC